MPAFFSKTHHKAQLGVVLSKLLIRMLIGLLTSILLISCEQANTTAQQLKERAAKTRTDGAKQKPEIDIPMVAGVTVIKDVVYGVHPKQNMDIYAPAKANNAPIIMTLRGGGWTSGDKEELLSYINKVNRWVPKGFIVVSVDTRLMPDADVYAQIDDLAQAVAHVQTHAAQWGGQADKLILMGHSSAGTMVSVLAADPAIVTKKVGGKTWLASIALDSTTLDVPRSMRLWSPSMIAYAYGKDEKRWLSASPVNLLNQASIPMLFACSTQRRDSSCEQAGLFVNEAKKFDVVTQVVTQPYDHGGVDFNLGVDEDYTQAVERFMARFDTDVAHLLDMGSER